jgi:hypothetical protein
MAGYYEKWAKKSEVMPWEEVEKIWRDKRKIKK